jgi:hypothetical protein
MPSALRATATAVFGALLCLLVVAWWVLESEGVAIVETRAADGAIRSTHVWHVRRADQLWLEAGTPQNGWYLDIQRTPELTITIDGVAGVYRAVPVHDRVAQREVRELLRAKYGWRDRTVGLFVDAAAAVPVRLIPIALGIRRD